MRSAVPFLAALFALPGCDTAPPEPRVTVENALVVLPVLPGRPGAAYFVLRTNNDPTRLATIASPRIGRIELHETVDENGIARMRPITNATFDPGHPLSFMTGGRHAMLFDIDPAVRAGSTIPLTFSFDPVSPVTVQAEVRAAGQGHQLD